MLELDLDQALAKGSENLVFQHPDNPKWLIKVLNPKYRHFADTERPISTRLRRISYYWAYVNEIIEHVAMRDGNVPDIHFVQKIIGFADTSLGLGLVFRAVRNEQGGLAYNLHQLIERGGFGEEQDRALDDILHWMRNNHVIIRDLSLNNMVWDHDRRCFVIIDGIGARYLPSLRPFSKAYNLRSNRKRADKVRARVAKKLARYPQNLENPVLS